MGLAILLVIWYIVLVVIGLLLLALTVASRWTLFRKAGKQGWEAVVPFYSFYTLCDISSYKPMAMTVGYFLSNMIGQSLIKVKPTWLHFIGYIFVIISYVIIITLYSKLGDAFGKGTGFKLGLVFFTIIFLPVLAFGGSYYVGKKGGYAGYNNYNNGYNNYNNGYNNYNNGYNNYNNDNNNYNNGYNDNNNYNDYNSYN